jgi:hypothetical protein
MMNNFTLHITTFADRVRAMNQMKNNELKLTATEANNLLADITQLAMQNVSLVEKVEQVQSQTVEIRMDGGSF